jgi:membrane protease subunit (stomatin/prohibitin family)
MGLFNKLKGEFIDVIEWTDSSSDTMVYRFERYGNEIKNGAKLTVRESQAAVFINEGQLADVFKPGMYDLTTANLPVLSTLKGWKHGFESPFKAEVYFVNTKRFTDLKWGTQNPIMLRDKEFGPVRLRAFGSYSIRVTDPAVFLKEIVGTDDDFNKDEVTGQLRNIVVSRFSDALGESGIAVLDLASNYNELGDFLQ